MDIVDVSTICTAFFLLGAAVGIGGTLIPSLRQQVINYGSRGITPSDTAIRSKPTSMLECIGSIQVPHTWFTHYYIVSVASSIFWAFQIITRGPVFKFLASYSQHDIAQSMTVNQVALAWGFMAFQGGRRLYESFTLTKPTQSKMWVGIWAVGIAYYIFMGISVWIEGIGTLNATENPLDFVDFSKPSLKTCVAVPIFVAASIIQHECHEHLASLKNECLVYLAITVAAAPQGQILNRTMSAGLFFVVSNLGVTADSTREWYIKKLGVDKLVGRWRMVPYVY